MRVIFRIFITLLLTVFVAQTAAWPLPSTGVTSSAATLTEAHGSVYKRGFQDWERQLWGDPVPATIGDTLNEGMQVGTGNKSWAQLTWPNISTRAWANSVYAIAPNKRLVYLVGGEMLYHLDKNRKDKSPYYVWTNLLQARIRGTTVLFQCTKKSSRITVLEGCVDVMNRLDHSVVQLKPGVVFEIKERGSSTENEAGQTGSSIGGDALGDLSQITKPDAPAIPVFQTAKTISTVTAVDPQAILSLPLIQSFSTPLESLPLVQESMTLVTQALGPLTQTISGITSSRFFKSVLTVQAVPTLISYTLGPAISVSPKLTAFFPPNGLIGGGSATSIANLPLNALTSTGNLVLPNGLGTGLFGASLPFAGSSTGAAMAPALAGAPLAAAGFTGLPGIGGIAGIGGAGFGGAFGLAGGLTGAVGGTANSLLSPVGGALNTTTSTAGGLVGGLTTTINGLIP